MILDSLANRSAIFSLTPRLRRAIDYLRATDVSALSEGRHDIDGDRLFALVHRYRTRPPADCRWEAHRKYVDVQYVVAGVERMGILSIAHAREQEAYDETRDVAFFEPGTDYVTVAAGMYAIFSPDDVHSPSVAAGEPGAVTKIVLKVAAGEE